MIGTVDTLWRYPVKSMAGERLESAALSWRGIPGDRGHQKIQDSVDKVVAACAKHGKWPGMGGAYSDELLKLYTGKGMKMILSGNEDALTPILQAIHDLVEELREEHSEDEAPIEDETLHLVLMALGDALFGAPLARALGLPRTRAREIAYESMINSGIGKRG